MGRKLVRDNELLQSGGLLSFPRTGCAHRAPVILSRGQRSRHNGQPRAIQPQSLFASQQFATAIYQSELTYRLRQLGYEITTGRSGAPEIKARNAFIGSIRAALRAGTPARLLLAGFQTALLSPPHGRDGGASGLALSVWRPPELRSTSRLASIFSGKALRKRT